MLEWAAFASLSVVNSTCTVPLNSLVIGSFIMSMFLTVPKTSQIFYIIARLCVTGKLTISSFVFKLDITSELVLIT